MLLWPRNPRRDSSLFGNSRRNNRVWPIDIYSAEDLTILTGVVTDSLDRSPILASSSSQYLVLSLEIF